MTELMEWWLNYSFVIIGIMKIETSFYFTQKGFNTSNFELNRGTVVVWLKDFNQ